MYLRRNELENSCHQPLATLENKDSPEECYRHINCELLITFDFMCNNCKKLKETLNKIRLRHQNGVLGKSVAHSSKQLLTEIILKERNVSSYIYLYLLYTYIYVINIFLLGNQTKIC
jgi:hypothetical protein